MTPLKWACRGGSAFLAYLLLPDLLQRGNTEIAAMHSVLPQTRSVLRNRFVCLISKCPSRLAYSSF